MDDRQNQTDSAEHDPPERARDLHPEPHTPHAAWGTIALIAGSLILGLATLEGMGGVPFSLPRSWYINRSIWLFLGLAGVIGGILLLRPPAGDERDTR